MPSQKGTRIALSGLSILPSRFMPSHRFLLTLLILTLVLTQLPPVSAATAPLPQAEKPSAAQTLNLRTAFDETLLSGPRAASIRAQLGIARSAYAQATVFPNPAVVIDNGYRAEQTYRFGAAFGIEPPWKVAFRFLVAKREVTKADLEIQRTLWILRNDVRRAYLDIVVAQETAATLKELTDLSQALVDVARKRKNAGDVPQLDVLRAHVAMTQAKVEYEKAVRQTVRAKQQLNILMGRADDTSLEAPRLPPFQLKAEAVDLLPDLTAELPPLKPYLAQAYENRLDLKIVNQGLRLAKANLLNAYGNILPAPVVSIGRSVANNPPDGPRLTGWFLAGEAQVPILDRQQGERAKFSATIKQLKLENLAQKNIIYAQIADAHQRLITAREQIRTYHESLLAESAEVVRLAQRSYEVGHADITTTLTAQQANIQVRLQYLDAIRNYQQALTDLEQAVGRPLQ